MQTAIFHPLEEFEQTYQKLHREHTTRYFEELTKQSVINVEENQQTVAQYNLYRENASSVRKKYNWWRFFRVLMILTLILIPLVILKITPKIQNLRSEMEHADQKAEECLNLAYQQMFPLNQLFTEQDCLTLIQKTIPFLSFDSCFTAKKEADMVENYDFLTKDSSMESTLDLLSGSYNGNPFLFENKLIHTMGSETYHGYKTISWTESYHDEKGNLCHRTRSETLHATVTKPKPIYSTQVVLHYGAQGGATLSFSRDASYLHKKSENAVKRYVKRGEKRIKRMTERAIRKNDDFTGMANSEFEVLFDALDRTDEVQFRALFTPLAQTNMVSLLLSQTGYGDDFSFQKRNRMNRIVSKHSQGRELFLFPDSYISYSYDVIKENFMTQNEAYFKAVYFDFAPLLSIPAYQERPVHSLKPIPQGPALYSLKESEALANLLDVRYVVHPDSKTQAILKSEFLWEGSDMDHISVTAYSYDMISRTDYVSVRGGDGHYHEVPVVWDEYIPLENDANFCISNRSKAEESLVMASRNGLSILKMV